MKMRISKNNLASFLCGGVVCLTACISMSSNDVEKVIESRPVVSSMTLSPDVPSSVPFCGKLIDITRYDMREAYDRELSSFTYFHSTTMLLIKRANRYFPVIEPILKANGIPDDFKYLAVIESHLDPRVSSPARAVGMWQLLEGTAREYGLTITPTVDERCHVEKATGAACRYLKAAYKKYGDWAAVAASYNGEPFSMICCPSNVQHFLRSVGLPGTPSERVRVWLRRRLRISAPTVLFAQSQGEMFKTKYMSSK